MLLLVGKPESWSYVAGLVVANLSDLVVTQEVGTVLLDSMEVVLENIAGNNEIQGGRTRQTAGCCWWVESAFDRQEKGQHYVC